MSSISTHVLDTSLGKPAQGISITLERNGKKLGSSVTDADGRVRDLVPPETTLSAGIHTLTFDVADYFTSMRRESFYERIVISFKVGSGNEHYHVPLLLSPFGYSTYRGS